MNDTTQTQPIITDDTLLLLQALYQFAKDSDCDGVLNSSRTLTLSGVSTSIQNRVMLLANVYCEIEDISFTIECILKEISPAEKINISKL